MRGSVPREPVASCPGQRAPSGRERATKFCERSEDTNREERSTSDRPPFSRSLPRCRIASARPCLLYRPGRAFFFFIPASAFGMQEWKWPISSGGRGGGGLNTPPCCKVFLNMWLKCSERARTVEMSRIPRGWRLVSLAPYLVPGWRHQDGACANPNVF